MSHLAETSLCVRGCVGCRQGVRNSTSTHPAPSPAHPFFFPTGKCTLLELFHSTGCSSSKYLDEHFFFSILKPTQATFWANYETHTHTHTWRQDVFPASLEGWQTRERGGGEGGGGRLHADLPLESLPDAACGQARFQFENLPACLPPWNLQPVIANNATT